MPQIHIAFFLTYLLSAFPLTFAILLVFQEEIRKYDFLDFGEKGLFMSFFFSFGMAVLGLFIDTLRHAIEWFVEFLADKKLTENGEREQCAFYPRLKIEDMPEPEAKKYGGFSEVLFERKLARYEPRYFAAEGLLSFALSCMLGLLLIFISKNKEYLTQRSFAMWFLFISCPVCIIFSFLWCRDKAKFINKVLTKVCDKNNKVRLLCVERKLYFLIFSVIFVVITLLYLFTVDFKTKVLFLVLILFIGIYAWRLYYAKENGTEQPEDIRKGKKGYYIFTRIPHCVILFFFPVSLIFCLVYPFWKWWIELIYFLIQ